MTPNIRPMAVFEHFQIEVHPLMNTSFLTSTGRHSGNGHNNGHDEGPTSIHDIAKDIKDLSADIGILAINAAIETAHATTAIEELTESILNNLMITQCRMVAELLCLEQFRSSAFLEEFARRTGISDIYVTDDDGVVLYSTNPGAVGWQFPKDPKAQTYVFYELVTRKDHVVCQKLAHRSIDDSVFKYVGVSRIDQPGIVQVGLKGDEIVAFRGQSGNVFAVIAQEIRHVSTKMAGVSRQLTSWTKTHPEVEAVEHRGVTEGPAGG